ncbi:hypothetical protein M3O96_02665 [Aquiflexum sp. TKW24L]|uniref:hypothetical protein n=1 Tax=Aquiflexum sp. TKW24L TaxID=2942212 RepID=UPI0020BDDAE0|nr:hypothetical protein [Aquiflexum sp. TKW24L]MCL6257975.1 hypothetical protein [Aquiflexum sp. TKW24L]
MKKLSLLFTLSLVCSISMAQVDRYWKLQNYTNPDEIETITESEISEEFEKIGTVFAKAKGVTVISAINSVNNRALRKLKTETSMRGGSHILFLNETQENNIFSKTTAYSAILYRSQKLDIEEFKNLLNANNYSFKLSRKYNRNKFSHRDDPINRPLKNSQWNEPYLKNGKIIIEITENIGSSNRLIKYEVIAFSETQILLFIEDIPGIEMRLISLERT